MHEANLVENIPLERNIELASHFSALADKAAAEEEDDLAPAIALRLLAGWLEAKAIARRSANAKIVKEARKGEDLYLFHIRSILRILRGERG